MKNNIAEIRRSLKMDQDELAKRLNVAKTYISTLENRSDINHIMAYKIAATLNTTINRMFDFSDRKRTKPNFNPHLEAFWTQGCEARESLSAENRVIFIDRQLCCLGEELNDSVAPIRDIMYLRLFNLYCLLDYANDLDTKENITDMELLFAGGMAGADFFVCAAILDNRIDIIQSFINGLKNVREPRGGKEGCNNLQKIREQKGLTQSALARKSKITLSILRMIESKNHCSDVHFNNAKKIAKALDCEFSDLFSPLPKDIHNVEAKRVGAALRKDHDIEDLIKALDRDIGAVGLCIKDIIAYLNRSSAKQINQAENIQYTLS